jgi:SAM-dependent methyltransferase
VALKDLLAHPALYQMFQEGGGFFAARLVAIARYLPLRGDKTIIDIACGPGAIASRLPAGVRYVGYDPSAAYIDYAVRRHGKRGRFVLGYFDRDAAAQEGGADVVMLNGVLHHMTDDEVKTMVQLASTALKSNGRLFAFEPCLLAGQSSIARFLINKDRGKHIRREPEYRSILGNAFAQIESHVDEDITRIPYTFVTIVARGPASPR